MDASFLRIGDAFVPIANVAYARADAGGLTVWLRDPRWVLPAGSPPEHQITFRGADAAAAVAALRRLCVSPEAPAHGP